ncbi:MAG: amino acid carrier protein [Rhodothermales bacterium]
MEHLEQFIGFMNGLLAPVLVTALLGVGLILTIRLGFIQIRKLGHGFAVTTGRYDDPDTPGDVSHFQALTTALSATVGIGNIAGVAIAIHWGGPGALFWMWMTALLGMATKYSEVTLAQHFRQELRPDGKNWAGSVAGGPMYYIEHGLAKYGKKAAKYVAVFFACALMLTSFLTGNAIQANTLATQMYHNFGVSTWITGLITASLVGIVIIGGIRRIGAVTGVLAPVMAFIYVLGALIIIFANPNSIGHAFSTIFSEAFNPSAGVAGTGVGVFLLTMQYGVQRGLFSNEAGQGSAPIAHSAAKTDEPVSEGVVALLEPFIDTIIICTITGIVVVGTGVYNERVETTLELNDGNISFVEAGPDGGFTSTATPGSWQVANGEPVEAGGALLAYFDVPVDGLYTDEALTQPFSGTLLPSEARAEDASGQSYTTLYGRAVRSSSPLTTLAFERGMEPMGLGWLGRLIVLVCVILFALSTAISWSYYGDRCAHYLFGEKAILPYKTVYVIMHFVGATLAVTTIWDLGDVALSLVTIPNVIALLLLSGLVKQLTDSYFERRAWEKVTVKKKTGASV